MIMLTMYIVGSLAFIIFIVYGSLAFVFRKELKQAWKEYREEKRIQK